MVKGVDKNKLEQHLEKAFTRFITKVDTTSDKCWAWKAHRDKKGYGKFYLANVTAYAHIFSYIYYVGSIQKGMQIDHLCRNTSCVNPKHLEQVTPKINVLRSQSPSAKNKRKKQCTLGHLLKGSNLIEYQNLKRGGVNRKCRKCAYEAYKRFIERCKASGKCYRCGFKNIEVNKKTNMLRVRHKICPRKKT